MDVLRIEIENTSAERRKAGLRVFFDGAPTLGLSDRVLVMRTGNIVAEFPREDATEEKIISCASGLT